MPVVRVRVEVEGRVQGVWFRQSTNETAGELGVSGWVRNRSDGSVEAVFEGDEVAVAKAVAWTHSGPKNALVTEVREFAETPEGLAGFEVRA
jgi:acylphosphatase